MKVEPDSPNGKQSEDFYREFGTLRVTTDGNVSKLKVKVCHTPSGELRHNAFELYIDEGYSANLHRYMKNFGLPLRGCNGGVIVYGNLCKGAWACKEVIDLCSKYPNNTPIGNKGYYRYVSYFSCLPLKEDRKGCRTMLQVENAYCKHTSKCSLSNDVCGWVR